MLTKWQSGASITVMKIAVAIVLILTLGGVFCAAAIGACMRPAHACCQREAIPCIQLGIADSKPALVQTPRIAVEAIPLELGAHHPPTQPADVDFAPDAGRLPASSDLYLRIRVLLI